jgi:hypothetical protein
MVMKLYRLDSDGVECIFTASEEHEYQQLKTIAMNMLHMGFDVYATVMESES